jgi:hypothetical protein
MLCFRKKKLIVQLLNSNLNEIDITKPLSEEDCDTRGVTVAATVHLQCFYDVATSKNLFLFKSYLPLIMELQILAYK